MSSKPIEDLLGFALGPPLHSQVLGEVGVQPFLARGRPLVGRPLFFWRLSCGQPRQPAGPAGEMVAVAGGDGRAVLGDDARDLVRRGVRGPQQL